MVDDLEVARRLLHPVWSSLRKDKKVVKAAPATSENTEPVRDRQAAARAARQEIPTGEESASVQDALWLRKYGKMIKQEGV